LSSASAITLEASNFTLNGIVHAAHPTTGVLHVDERSAQHVKPQRWEAPLSGETVRLRLASGATLPHHYKPYRPRCIFNRDSCMGRHQ
jgi:hypothetical protein